MRVSEAGLGRSILSQPTYSCPFCRAQATTTSSSSAGKSDDKTMTTTTTTTTTTTLETEIATRAIIEHENRRICKLCPTIDEKGTILYMKEDNCNGNSNKYNNHVISNKTSKWIHAVCIGCSQNKDLQGLIGIIPNMKCVYCSIDNGLLYVCAHKGCSTPLHMSCALMYGNIDVLNY